MFKWIISLREWFINRIIYRGKGKVRFRKPNKGFTINKEDK